MSPSTSSGTWNPGSSRNGPAPWTQRPQSSLRGSETAQSEGGPATGFPAFTVPPTNRKGAHLEAGRNFPGPAGVCA